MGRDDEAASGRGLEAAASWDDLRVFVHVARAGTMTAAARSLGISQPTVGRRLEALQAVLGELLTRDGGQLTLTKLGREVLPHAEAAEANVRALVRCAERPNDEDIHLSTTLGLATHFVAPMLPRLTAAAGARLAVRMGIEKADVMRREADVVLRIGQPGDDRLVGSRVGTMGSGLYAAESYLAEHGTPTSLDSLSVHAIVESEGSIERLVQVEALRRWTREAEVRLSADNVSFQVAAVERGAGIAALPCFMVDESRGVRRILAEEFDVGIDIWLLANPNLRGRPGVRKLLDALREELAAKADWLAGR